MSTSISSAYNIKKRIDLTGSGRTGCNSRTSMTRAAASRPFTLARARPTGVYELASLFELDWLSPLSSNAKGSADEVRPEERKNKGHHPQRVMAFFFAYRGFGFRGCQPMKIAYQGEPGAFSEAASRLVSADATLVPCKSFEDVFAAGRAGAGAVRRAADRELDWRQHPPQLRPADGEPPADRRRGGSAGRPSPAGAAGRVDGRHQARLFASAGAGAVRALSADADRRRDHRDLRHGGQREDGGRRQADRHGGDRVGARRRDLRPRAARVVDSGLQRQHHAVHRHRPRARSPTRRPTRRRSCFRCRTSRARCSRR